MIVNKNSIIRLTPSNKSSIIIADNVFKNKYFFIGALDTIQFEEKIDWSYNHKTNAKSYQIYMHGLQPISFLVNAYEITNEDKYLYKGLELIQDWIKYDEKNKDTENLVWYDHTVANRTISLLYFYINAIENIEFDKELIYKQIIACIKYLLDNKNYNINNHGIMMDKALLMSSFILSNEESETWYIKAISRLKETFYCSFSQKGTHLENSTFYHRLAYRLFYEIEEYLNNNDRSLGESIVNRLEKIKSVNSYVAKPDLYFPQIGDSVKFNDLQVEKKYDDFLDIDAGLAIIQNEDINNSKDTFWLLFKCGYSTKIHKHLDDLSFTSYFKGHDIFVDSGGYGYGSSKERLYVRSPLAHNTFTIKDKKYSLLDPKDSMDKIRITSFDSNNNYSMVKGINNAFNEVELERCIIHFKENITLIYDRGKSKNNKKYTFIQNYNLSTELKIKNIYGNDFNLYSGDNEVSVKQIEDIDLITTISGNKSIPIAVVSEKSGRVIDTNQIRVEKSGVNVELLTLITYGNDDNVKNISLNTISNQILITINDIDYSINI